MSDIIEVSGIMPTNKINIPARTKAIKDHAVSGITATSKSSVNTVMIFSFVAGGFIGAIITILTFAKY